MRSIFLITLLVSVFLLICPSCSFGVTIWAAAEHFDEFVDDPGDGVKGVTFEGREAVTGGGIYFTEKNPVQGAIETTYYEYDLGECPKDADGEIWRAWGRFEWTGGVSGCNSFGLIWLKTDGQWTSAYNFGNDDPFLKPWHWKDIDASGTLPALSAGDPIKVRITERESQDKEDLTPLLDVFCLTTDPAYIPKDDDVPKLKAKAVKPVGKLSVAWGQIRNSR